MGRLRPKKSNKGLSKLRNEKVNLQQPPIERPTLVLGWLYPDWFGFGPTMTCTTGMKIQMLDRFLCFLVHFQYYCYKQPCMTAERQCRAKKLSPRFFLKIYTKNKNTHWKIFCSCCTSVYPRNSGLWEQSSAQITRQLHLYFHNCTEGFISKFRITFQRQICLPAIQSLSSSYLKRKSSAKMHPALHTSTEDM